MNIFVTSPCPIQSAKNLANRHSVRMPLESLGMLAFAFPEGEAPVPNLRSNRHFKHPASVWGRQSKENFEWLLTHGLAQCEEYTHRYKREHDSEKHIRWIWENHRFIDFDSNDLTPFARCFSSFKDQINAYFTDTIDAYQEFYRLDKKDFAKWPSQKMIPDWWIDKSEKWVDKNFKDGIYIKR